MKRLIFLGVAVAMLLMTAIGRADDEDVFWGALLGAGAGLILGESVDGIHSSVAVPVGAIAGGLIGHELDRASYRHGWYERYDPHAYHYYGYPYTRYGPRVHSVPRRLPKVRKLPGKAVRKVTPPADEAPDLQPGVDLVKVQVRLISGVPMDVRLLRMPDNTFVGPQGETYTNLPTSAELVRYTGR